MSEAEQLQVQIPLPCLVCGRTLVSAFGPGGGRQPSEAVMFLAYGNYGSTVYDPLVSQAGRQWLEVNVCDACLLKAGQQGRIAFAVSVPQPNETVYTPWKGPETSDDWVAPS